MNPYYQDEQVTLYHGDALEVLPVLTPGTAHAIVTDPPYVIGAVSAGSLSSKSGGWGDMMNSALWFTSWYRLTAQVLKSAGALWSFCNWRTLPVVMRAASDAGLPVESVLVWDKEWIGPGGQRGLRPSYELVVLIPREQFAVGNRGVADIWRHKVGSYKPNGHPAEKPEGLVRRIIQVSDVPSGGLVVDPFIGSGTTALAAKSLGVRCIGIEYEERWCELAASRLAQDELAFT